MKLLYLFCLVTLLGCTRAREEARPAPLRTEGGELVVDAAGPFAKRLSLETVNASEKKFSLRVIGQILALGNPSGALRGEAVSWTELDPLLTKAAGLRLPTNAPSFIGTAFGAARVPAEYEAQVKAGHPVEISHYGLGGSHLTGRIVSVKKEGGDADGLEVVFSLSRAADWYPGLNCELSFPLFQVQSVRIPQAAILHEGNREYVFAQTAKPSHYRPVPVVVASEDQRSAEVMGLSPQNQIVTEGAILLKPEIHRLLQSQEVPRAP